MTTTPSASSPTYVFSAADRWTTLRDGSTVTFREARVEDEASIRALYASLTPESIYLRFFSRSPLSVEQDVQRLLRRAPDQHEALVAEHNGELVAVGCYELMADRTKAEIAMVMGEHLHGLGLGSAFIRHLATVAKSRGITTFRVDALGRGDFMTEVVHNLGLPVEVVSADLGTIEYEVALS